MSFKDAIRKLFLITPTKTGGRVYRIVDKPTQHTDCYNLLQQLEARDAVTDEIRTLIESKAGMIDAIRKRKLDEETKEMQDKLISELQRIG